MEIIAVKTVEEVLKHALMKELKPVKWVEIDQVSNKNKEKIRSYKRTLIVYIIKITHYF